ncbi:MAG: SIS domain-containing protein [Calditrichia bacterium]
MMDHQTAVNSITYREIRRQPEIWKTALNSLRKEAAHHQQLLEIYKDRYWIFTGCGTSYYLAQSAAFLFQKFTGFHSCATPASEILIFPHAVFQRPEKSVLVTISRSGESTEVVMAARQVMHDFKIPTIAVSCNKNSSLAKEGSHRLPFPFQQEESVVMTGSFTTMLLSILNLALQKEADDGVFREIEKLPENLEHIFTYSIDKLENAVRGVDDFVFLGQGPFLGIANEGALKMQEMSISHSQSFNSLEYRHGPKSTAAKSTLITLLLSSAGKKLEYQLAEDLKNLGAKLLIVDGIGKKEVKDLADFYISIPPVKYPDAFNPVLYTPVLQLLGFYKALAKGINPDKPQNLTAVVTFNPAENGRHE